MKYYGQFIRISEMYNPTQPNVIEKIIPSNQYLSQQLYKNDNADLSFANISFVGGNPRFERIK